MILDIDEKKVKSHLQNAKRNLKLCLEGKTCRTGIKIKRTAFQIFSATREGK